MDGVPRPPYDAVDLAYAVNGFQRAANDLTAVLAAADRLAEAVPEGEESADGQGVRLTWDEYQTLIRAATDYRRIREGSEG